MSNEKIGSFIVALLAVTICLSASADEYQYIISSPQEESSPASTKESTGIVVNTGSLGTPTSPAPLEARGKTWLASNAIGIDPFYVPGFLLMLK